MELEEKIKSNTELAEARIYTAQAEGTRRVFYCGRPTEATCAARKPAPRMGRCARDVLGWQLHQRP